MGGEDVGIVKHGTGEVLRDDGAKTAATWTGDDEQELAEENAKADSGEAKE